jgi:hypothetical protein
MLRACSSALESVAVSYPMKADHVFFSDGASSRSSCLSTRCLYQEAATLLSEKRSKVGRGAHGWTREERLKKWLRRGILMGADGVGYQGGAT